MYYMQLLADLTNIFRLCLSGDIYIGSATVIEPRKADLRTGSGLAHAAMRDTNRVPVGNETFRLASLVDIRRNLSGVIQPEPIGAETARHKLLE